jgi:capsular polysaccharide biosynthesis protein
MNYAIKMLDTYVELFKTYEFNQTVANDLNQTYGTSYTAGQVRGAVSFSIIENTSMFKVSVTTTDADLSYMIAKQLETSIPKKMSQTNNGLVLASVEDVALKASGSESLGYTKKCAIGFLFGAIVSIAYVILRDLIDVRIKYSDDLSERYDIPVLGSIPEFELKPASKINKDKEGRD